MKIEVVRSRASQVCDHKPLERLLARGVEKAKIKDKHKETLELRKYVNIKYIIVIVPAVIPADNIFCIFISSSAKYLFFVWC